MNITNKLSVVICTFNEEKKIEACLRALSFTDEIIVVDDGSTDNTVKIVKKYTQNIYHHKSVGYVEPVRNFAISKATGDWILILDADERVEESLAEKLKEISLLETEAVGVLIPRKNIIFGKWIKHTGWWPDYQLRFFKKGCVNWSTKIHQQPEIKGKTLELESKEDYALLHHHYETVSDYMRKMNLYTDIEVSEFLTSGKSFNWTDMIRKPFNEFLSRFFARGGYKDGLHGLVLAFLQMISMFIVELKVWEHYKFEEVDPELLFKGTEKEMSMMRKDLMYWFTHEKIDNIKNPLQKNAYKMFRKFIK